MAPVLKGKLMLQETVGEVPVSGKMEPFIHKQRGYRIVSGVVLPVDTRIPSLFFGKELSVLQSFLCPKQTIMNQIFRSAFHFKRMPSFLIFSNSGVMRYLVFHSSLG